MPEFMVTSPEGKQFRITAPDGTTKDQALAKFQETQDSGSKASPNPSSKSGSGLWNTAADFFKSIPGGMAEGSRSPGAFGTQGALEAPDEGLEKARAGAAQQLHQPEGFFGRAGSALGTASTNPITYTPMGGPAKTILGAMGSVIGGQAGSELGAHLFPKATLDRWLPEKRLTDAQVGGAPGDPNIAGALGGFAGGATGGAAGARVGGGGAPAASARTSVPKAEQNPTVDAAVKTLKSFGVEPPAGAVTGSPMVSDLERFGGGRAVQGAEKQFTEAGAGLMGTMSSNISNEVLKQNMKRMRGDFERSLAPLAIKTDEELLNGITDLRQDMLRKTGKKTWRKIDALIDDAGLGDELDASTPPRWIDNGQGALVMKGEDYHTLVKTESDLDNAIHSGNPDLAPYAKRLRDMLDDALERSSAGNPATEQALALFKKTKEDYFNQKVINEAVVRDVKEGPRRGLIDAGKLYDRLQTYGWDGGTPHTKLQELASAGNTAVPRYRPGLSGGHDPGSGRALARAGGASLVGGAVGGVAGMLTGGPVGAGAGGAIGAAAGPYLAGKAINSPVMQSYLKNRRQITAQMRALVPPEEATKGAARAALRGTIGASSAQKKKQRIYEE